MEIAGSVPRLEHEHILVGKVCLRVLQQCKAPLRALDNTQLVVRLMKAGVYKESSPEYVAIQITEAREGPERCAEGWTVVELLAGGFDDIVVHSLGLGTAKHVVLLECYDWDAQRMLTRGRDVESSIRKFWKRKGIPAGVVEIV
jgi:hypothetical protein